ncbi:MAG: cation:proton antiporter, partial [Gammaproteobacteria bacterium]
MEAHSFFLYVLIILLSARFLGELARHFGVPSVIGELLAGVILGPSLLGFVPASDVLHLLAEVGLILLLFEVGLETDVGHLAKAGPRALVVATGGFILPLVLGFSLSYWLLGLPTLISLFIGGTLTATSIGITVRVLRELGRLNTTSGQIVLGAAVADDVMGVVFLAVLYQFAQGGTVNFASAGKVLVFVTAFFLLAPVFAKVLGYLIKRYCKVSEMPGLLPTMIISLVL